MNNTEYQNCKITKSILISSAVFFIAILLLLVYVGMQEGKEPILIVLSGVLGATGGIILFCLTALIDLVPSTQAEKNPNKTEDIKNLMQANGQVVHRKKAFA